MTELLSLLQELRGLLLGLRDKALSRNNMETLAAELVPQIDAFLTRAQERPADHIHATMIFNEGTQTVPCNICGWGHADKRPADESERSEAQNRQMEAESGTVIIPCKLCVDSGNRYSRWLFFPHPDGQWVTAFKVTEEQSQMLGHWHRRNK